MRNSFIITIFLSAIIFSRCTKDKDGDFSFTIDGESQKVVSVYGQYDIELKTLRFAAKNSNGRNIEFVIYVPNPDSLHTVKLLPNGTNAAKVWWRFKNPGYSSDVLDIAERYSDESDASLNGHFTLTKMDFNKKTISGNFAFKAVASSGIDYTEVTEGWFEDCQISISPHPYSLSGKMRCDVDPGEEWYTENVGGSTRNATSTIVEKLDIDCTSFNYLRILAFDLPLSTGTGTFPLTSDPNGYRGRYINFNHNEYELLPGGTITITSIDRTTKVFEATFSAQFRDRFGTDVITFTNGEVSTTWK